MIQIRDNMHKHSTCHTVTPVPVRPCFVMAITRMWDAAMLAYAKQEGAKPFREQETLKGFFHC